jgi:hypothetical protein
MDHSRTKTPLDKAQTDTNKQSLPSQYPVKGNMVSQDDHSEVRSESDDSSVLSNLDNDFTTDDLNALGDYSTDALGMMVTSAKQYHDQRNIHMSRTTQTTSSGDIDGELTSIHTDASDTTVRCNSEIFSRAYAAISNGWHYSTTDGGSDTMILGEGWRFTHIYPSRSVNIIGFNEKHAQRSGCQVGTSVSVMMDENNHEYLVIAHEAAQNAGSRTSLLSESPMRNYGLIVDSTSNKHIGVDHNPGTQSIFFPTERIRLKLYQKLALMICPHRAVTDDDLTELPQIVLTLPIRWSPQAHQDDDDIIMSLRNPNALTH